MRSETGLRGNATGGTVPRAKVKEWRLTEGGGDVHTDAVAGTGNRWRGPNGRGEPGAGVTRRGAGDGTLTRGWGVG